MQLAEESARPRPGCMSPAWQRRRAVWPAAPAASVCVRRSPSTTLHAVSARRARPRHRRQRGPRARRRGGGGGVGAPAGVLCGLVGVGVRGSGPTLCFARLPPSRDTLAHSPRPPTLSPHSQPNSPARPGRATGTGAGGARPRGAGARIEGKKKRLWLCACAEARGVERACR